MSNTILQKRRITSPDPPIYSDLLLGELAVNTKTGRLFMRDNNDSIIDILDIISLVNFILYPVPMGWDFEEEWTGSDSYIFVQYDPSAPSSTALWLSSTRETLLNNSRNIRLRNKDKLLLSSFIISSKFVVIILSFSCNSK